MQEFNIEFDDHNHLVECINGDAWFIAGTVTDQDAVAIDLSGYTIEYALKDKVYATAFTIATTAVTLTGDEDGVISGKVLPAVTILVKEGSYIEETKIKNADGETVKRFQRTRVVKGRIITDN